MDSVGATYQAARRIEMESTAGDLLSRPYIAPSFASKQINLCVLCALCSSEEFEAIALEVGNVVLSSARAALFAFGLAGTYNLEQAMAPLKADAEAKGIRGIGVNRDGRV